MHRGNAWNKKDIRKGEVETKQGNHAQHVKEKLCLGGGRSARTVRRDKEAS